MYEGFFKRLITCWSWKHVERTGRRTQCTRLKNCKWFFYLPAQDRWGTTIWRTNRAWSRPAPVRLPTILLNNIRKQGTVLSVRSNILSEDWDSHDADHESTIDNREKTRLSNACYLISMLIVGDIVEWQNILTMANTSIVLLFSSNVPWVGSSFSCTKSPCHERDITENCILLAWSRTDNYRYLYPYEYVFIR